MYCPKCGKQLENDSKFCTNCGNPIHNIGVNSYPNYQPLNYKESPNNQKKSGTSNNNTIMIIIILISLGVLIFGLIKIFSSKTNSGTNVEAKERTIMIYMTGSDLEDSGLASEDLNDIVPSQIDLENINIVLIAGGARHWKNNYIKANETAIFELTEVGFNKVKTYQPIRNMGDASLLSDFLNYSYNNYKAHKYDLILWNHGSGIYGTNVDTLTNDLLSITEFEKALANSPFNQNNKLEYVNLIACLEGNLEYAIVLSKYAHFMVGSEEISLAAPFLNKFNTLTQVSITDDAFSINKRFIETYVAGLNELENYYNSFNEYNLSENDQKLIKENKKSLKSQTYSIIDLSKINQLQTAINDFFGSIDVANNYRKISKVRANMIQYGQVANSNDFDSVDIYELVTGLKALAPTKANNVINSLEEVVKYNWSNNDYSHGLAIYFPYYGKTNNINAALTYRKSIVKNDAYNTFITKFLAIKTGYSNMNWAFEEKGSDLTSSIKVNSEFGFYLTKDEALDYVNANYQIFRKYNNNYIPIYSSSNINFDEKKNYLKVNYTNRGLKINNEIKNIYLKEIANDGDFITYSIPVKIYKNETEYIEADLTYYFDVEKNYGYLGEITQNSKDNELLPNISVINLRDYKYIEFINTAYNIIENEKYTEEWSKIEDVEVNKLEIENLKIELVDLADEYEYVAVIQVYDVYGNGHYTPIIKIEN
ncbi:MAG: zinc-ribbon domain-containing protein [Bacilli bacterium]|nr:zinc-ribbon domain-containing protein [Bacilli bacterium]